MIKHEDNIHFWSCMCDNFEALLNRILSIYTAGKIYVPTFILYYEALFNRNLSIRSHGI